MDREARPDNFAPICRQKALGRRLVWLGGSLLPQGTLAVGLFSLIVHKLAPVNETGMLSIHERQIHDMVWLCFYRVTQ